MKKIIPFLFCLLLIGACENKAYDTDLLDKEVTLFNEEISVPIGNVGPFNLDLALNSASIGKVLGGILQTDADGTLISKSSDDIYKLNVYEIAFKSEDPTKASKYTVGDKSFTPSGMAGLLQMLGFISVDHQVTLSIYNPLYDNITINGNAYVNCRNFKTYGTAFEKTYPLDGKVVEGSYSTATKVLDETLPSTVQYFPSEISFKDIVLNVPGDLKDKIRSSDKDAFVFSASQRSRIAVGETTVVPLSMFGVDHPSVKFKLPIGTFEFKEVEASLDLENSLPLEVSLSDIQLLTGDKAEPDSNLEVTPGEIVLEGGNLENPGLTHLTLNIKAVSGSIPDITGITMTVAAKTAPGFAGTYLTTKQGISVKSANATLRGGITLGGHE